MPLAKGHSPKTISKNISEFHKGPTYAHTLAKFGKKKANKQAVAVALSTARKYADGGEVEESQDRLMHTQEGLPFVQAGNVIQPEGTGLYNLGKSVMQGMREPPPIKSQELPLPYEATPPATASPEIGKEILHDINPMRWFEQPPVKDIPPDAYKGKIEPNQRDWIAPVAAGLELGFSLPSGFGAGVSKAAIAFGAKMAGQQAAKQATKTLNPMKAALLAEHPGFLDTSGFKQAGHQLGFHAGGVYTNPADGVQYYLKTGPSIDQVQNEQLGAKLYALAGTPVAEVSITHLQGQPGIASKMLPNAHQLSETKLPYEQIPGLHDNFVVDAWLANHDAVGTGGENPLGNIMISNGKAVRIDSGGSLRYKGSGDPKKHFFDEADEVDSMRSYDFSKRSADVFHNVSPEALKIGAQKVADVRPEELALAIAQYGPSDTKESQNLINKLLKRREYIMNKFGVKPSWDKSKEQIAYEKANASMEAIEKELGLSSQPRPALKLTPEDWEKKIAEEQMIGEKDFSQGSLPDDYIPPVNALGDFDDTSRAVKAIQPEKGIAGWGASAEDVASYEKFKKEAMSPAYNLKNAIENFKSTAAAQELKPSQVETLFKKDDLSKYQAKDIVKSLVPSLSPPGTWIGDEPAKVAAYIWQIAEHAGPHKAEAIFRALPETMAGTRQENVGPILSKLKKDFGSSPWDDMSGGKYFVAKSLSFDPEKTYKFSHDVPLAKEIIGKKDAGPSVLSNAEKKKAMLLKNQEKAKQSYVADPKAEAKKIIAETGGDEYKMAAKLYAKANYNPLLADEIFKALPEKYNNVAAELNHMIEKRKYDPWDTKPGKLSAVAQIASDMKNVDWQTYKPVFQKELQPIEWGPVSKMIIKSLGFGTDFQLYHGKSTLSKETAQEFALSSRIYDPDKPIPLIKRYPTELKEPTELKPHEQAFFLSDKPGIARSYGRNVLPFLARPKKALRIDWGEINGSYGSGYDHNIHSYNADLMGRVIEAGRSRGADMIIVEGLLDQGSSGLQTQYLVLNPEILRGPRAKFDPAKLHLRMPLAGVAGGGLLAYGELAPQKRENKMKRGGSINTALRLAKEYASGGPGSAPWNVRRSSHIPHGPGMIQSAIPGRTDKLPLSIKSGSFILPADIPSALGEGNTMAGNKILSKMLDSGPMGTPKLTAPRVKKTKFPALGRFRKQKFADGGESEEVPIIAAGGEYIVGPEQVAGVGGGDLDEGHKVLKNFVLDVRRKNIKTLRKLKPPKMG